MDRIGIYEQEYRTQSSDRMTCRTDFKNLLILNLDSKAAEPFGLP